MRYEDMPIIITLARVREITGLDRRTIKRYVVAGKLRVHVTPGGQRRYFRDQVVAVFVKGVV
jgi:predicted site-specific integrase-resolvase